MVKCATFFLQLDDYRGQEQKRAYGGDDTACRSSRRGIFQSDSVSSGRDLYSRVKGIYIIYFSFSAINISFPTDMVRNRKCHDLFLVSCYSSAYGICG